MQVGPASGGNAKLLCELNPPVGSSEKLSWELLPTGSHVPFVEGVQS